MDKPKPGPTSGPDSKPISPVDLDTKADSSRSGAQRTALEDEVNALRFRYRSQLEKWEDTASSDARCPKWSNWRATPEVTLWEGVALSLGIEPALVKHSANSWFIGEHVFEEGSAFKERLLIASRNLGIDKPLRPAAGIPSDRAEALVKLPTFAAWAVKIGWPDLPEEFVAIAGDANPADITSHQHSTWLRKDTWTVRETAFLLNGWLPDQAATNNDAINQAVDDIKRALRAGGLHVIDEVSKADQFFEGQHLRPREVIMWALGRFPRFPFVPAHLPPNSQTPVSDYLNGKILIELMRWIARETERRKRANENSVADALAVVHAKANELLAGTPIAARDVVSRFLETHAEHPSEAEASTELSPREETTYLNVIAALLDVIKEGIPDGSGGTVGPANGFESEAKLMASIAGHYKGYSGLSVSNLQRKFPQAKRSIE